MNLDERSERCAQSVEVTDHADAAARPSRILANVTSQLSAVAPAQRRTAARIAGLFAAVLLIVGVTPWLRDSPTALRALAVVVLLAAVTLALVAWGLVRSVALEQASSSVDAAVEAAMAAGGHQMCDCGEAHDPDEMHITDACPSEGACNHDCATCKLTALKG